MDWDISSVGISLVFLFLYFSVGGFWLGVVLANPGMLPWYLLMPGCYSGKYMVGQGRFAVGGNIIIEEVLKCNQTAFRT